MKRILFLLLFIPSSLLADSLSILFLGDTHFGENYQFDPIYNHGTNYITKYGYDCFFKNVELILNGSDAVFCNLETPLTREINIISIRKPYLHWSDPDSTVKYFRKYNISFVSLGNNHVFDMGLNGFKNTVSSLKKGGLISFGAGNDLKEASGPVIMNQDSILAVVFSGFEYRPNYDTLYHYYADDSIPGVNMLDTVRLNRDISNYRILYPKAVIIIYPHWGSNYGKVNDRQIAFAHSWIDAGADAVIGQGTHTVQQIEKYKGKYIFYNIGNFIFNAPGRYASTQAIPYSLMVKLLINKGVISYTLYPLFTDNKKSGYNPHLLNTAEILELIEESFSSEVYYLIDEDNSIKLNN
jgi:poly-gamma-glutamate capsule biosynthesis protein CapA/YwtB (metallophosphatase superfamily)